ncbi:MAG: endonuclease MutS2 [Planctomycetota bacterium]|jgi:DNA mismatch repair protein MutS2
MNEEALRLLEYEGMKELFLPHLASDIGKASLERLLPSREEGVVRARLSIAEEAAAVLDRGSRLPLGGCRDLRDLLEQVRERGRPLEPDQLVLVRETLESARNLVLAVRSLADEHPDLELPRLGALVREVPGFTLLTDLIQEVVDDRGKVRDGASPRLSGIRDGIRDARERIERKVSTLLGKKDMRGCLQEGSARFRSGRLVLAVKAERRGEVRGILHGFSQSGHTCFVEPEEVVPDGNSLEDLLAQESREVTRILWETTVKVLEAEDDIRAALRALATADLAQASASAAREPGLTLPRLTESGVLRFRGARHPILMLLSGVEDVVPVDLRLGDDFHLLVITGPNTGGKTVALKTLGLLLLMAQSGLPVPAEEAEFSLMEEVFVDIGDEQSLQQSLSTFSSHVGRVSRFLGRAGERTLVLLDELGAGTDPAEGAALGTAILDFLHARRVPTLVTTHLGSLKTYAFTHEGASNACVEFDASTLSPTFRLLIGQPGASNALTIAERLGVPEEVVLRAGELLTPADRASAEILDKAQEIRTMAEDGLRRAEGLKVQTRELKERAEEELREASERRRHVEREAEDEMERALARLRGLVRDFAKELGNAPHPFGPKALELEKRAEEEVRATPLGRRREEFALTLRRGDEVFVPKLKDRFRVHAVKKKARTLTLIKGSLKIQVPFDDVTWVNAGSGPARTS